MGIYRLFLCINIFNLEIQTLYLENQLTILVIFRLNIEIHLFIIRYMLYYFRRTVCIQVIKKVM